MAKSSRKVIKVRVLIAVALLAIILLSACTINRPICATSNPMGTKIGTYMHDEVLHYRHW
ncbi:MAG: hypothetical protein RBS43_05815 [Candidatus Cloacimonas sp.]|nr:hypothetical protein [Candidatus Cloacimonas sp.]